MSPVGTAPKEGASNGEKAIHQTKVDATSFVQSGMLYAMESTLQKCFEKMSAFEINTNLKAIFAPQARLGRYEASELFFCSRMDDTSQTYL
jgi:hypothetical protein